jgi:hypothetical protein
MIKNLPLIEIPLINLELDEENPRIRSSEKNSQESILKELLNYHALKDLALSMKVNGYLNIEPIVIIPKDIDFDLEKVDSEEQLITILNEKIKKGDKFIVLEGNRRIATAKLICDETLRETLKIKSVNFEVDKEKLNSFEIINSSCYFDRKEVSKFIGLRHINSNLKWTSYSKAKYIDKRINELVSEGKEMNEAIKKIEEEIGDTTVMIKRFYFCYRITQEASENFDFDIFPITENFSFLTTAINYLTYRKFIGINVPLAKIIFNEGQLISMDYQENFKKMLTWIFGNTKEGKKALINESRDISNKLSLVLANKESIQYLIETDDLLTAFDYADGEKKFVITNFSAAISKLSNIKRVLWKIKNAEDKKEINSKIKELEEIIYSIKKELEND